MSVRVASIGENSTFSQRLFAKATASPALRRMSSRLARFCCSMCRSLVPTKVWMRGLCDHCTASQARTMSCSWMRARPVILGPYYVHLQAGELAGYLYLLLHGQGDPWRLLAVAECGVEDLYSTHVSRPPTFGNLLKRCDLRLVAADSRLDPGAGNSPCGHPG